jgi:tetrapyrrole methylase family protein / MazG family protein
MSIRKKKRQSPGIYIVGLGPGDPLLVTRQAWQLLHSVSEVYLRTSKHPVVSILPVTLNVFSFDELYEKCSSFEEVYKHIVEQVLELGRRPQGVVYAVPGHPFMGEATSPEISRRAREEGLPVKIIEGISFLMPTLTALGIDPLPHTVLVDALELVDAHVPPFSPEASALIAQVYSPLVASNVKLTLMEVYPDDHPVRFVHSAGTDRLIVEELPLHAIDQSPHLDMVTALYVPPLGPGSSFESFQEIIAHLRAPDGCPWDREQTHQSLRAHLLEEAYEVISALDADDPESLSEELGDLLLQIVLHAQIANEYGEFRMVDVIQKIHTKLVNRHPHVFGKEKLPDAESVVVNWERLKAAERKTSKKPETGLMDGVAESLPALVQAQTFQKRAARVGFDWPDEEGVLDKVLEEIQELRSAQEEKERAFEIGDLLFALVNLARWYDLDAESALRDANRRFKVRFSHIEETARSEGRLLTDLSLEEMEALWQAAKRIGVSDEGNINGPNTPEK